MKDFAAKRNTRDLICLSHLRWNFVFQRPQHLMTRFARTRRVFFFEEPIFDHDRTELSVTHDRNVSVCTPRMPSGLTAKEINGKLRRLIDDLHTTYDIERPIAWYYTPMALDFTRHLSPSATIFDCMDELSAFRGAPPELLANESDLLTRADLVFTGGQSLYEAKRERHRRVYPFPSSVDVSHFAAARGAHVEPDDQSEIPHPRLGFFGVVDERMDLDLLRGVAAARPDWHLVILGPCVKIDPATLPRADNLHYLGMKRYEQLPQYLSGWDVALLPFARNESTRFISPTKTPEYLAAGCPVVSTSVRDVVRPYGERGLVAIADSVDEWIGAVESMLAGQPSEWREEVDQFLSHMSWDRTWKDMSALIDALPLRTDARVATSVTMPDNTRRTSTPAIQPIL